MTISVILPVFNGSDYIAESIDSILSQDVDLELIVSDNASTDDTVRIVKSFSDSRIRLLVNEINCGIFNNLNICISQSKGDVVQAFSHDDIMSPGYLSSQLAALDKYPSAGMVYADPRYIDGNGMDITGNFLDSTPELIEWDLYKWISSHYGALPASISSVMVRRRTFDEIGLFDPTYSVAGDLEFYNRVGERYPIVRNAEVLHAVRSHRAMTSALPTTGVKYLQEERRLASWYQSRWSPEDYKKIVHFRAELRGRYHLGWIRRTAARGQLARAAAALWELNRTYSLGSILWWRLGDVLGRREPPYPQVAPPPRV